MKSIPLSPTRLTSSPAIWLSIVTFIMGLATLTQAATTLRVLNSQLNPESKISLVFDRGVATDAQLKNSAPTKLLKITPALPGHFFWKSANIVEFIPSSPPLMGCNYTFSIAKGHTFRNGKPLPAIKLKTISSEPFRVTYSTRRSGSLSTTRQPSYYIAFNDAITPTSAERFVYFYNDKQRIAAKVRRATWGDIKSTYRRGATWKDRFTITQTGKAITYSEDLGTPIPNAIMVTPTSPLPAGDGWHLRISEKLTNSANNAVHLKGRNIWIGDIDPLELNSITAFAAANRPRQIHVDFNAPIDPELAKENLSELIRITPTPKNIAFKVLGSMIIVDGDFRKQDKWLVALSPSIRSKNGLLLGATKAQKITFKDVPTGLALPAYDSAQYTHGNRLYGIDTVNLDSVRIRIKQLSADNAVRTMQGYQHYKGSGHNGKDLDPSYPMPYALISGKTIYDRTVHLDNGIDTSKEIPIDWNVVLNNNTSNALLFVSVEGSARDDVDGSNRIAQSLVQLTDIGLCWKLSEKEALIYAFSCQTGKPLPNVTLQVFNDDAQPAKFATTDANGIARLARNPDARHLRATLGNDIYLIPFDQTLDTVSLWRFPVDTEWSHLSGWKRSLLMFTDRALYRPGETVQLKGIVRQFLDNQITLTKDTTAQLTIKDSRSRILYDEKVTLSPQGTFDHTLKLPAETVGTFTAKLVFPENSAQQEENSWIANQHRIFRHRFQVQEFRRNAFEITSDIPKTNPGAEQITLNLNAKFYQGQPVKNGRVAWNFTATQTGFYPDKFRDFLFGDHLTYDPYYWDHYFGYGSGSSHKNRTDRNGEGQLDAQGIMSLSMEVPKLKKPSALTIRIHSEVTDSRDQTLSRSTSTVIHPADTYIGISRIDRLIRTGESPKIELIAVDTQENLKSPPVTATATIEREFSEAVKTQSPDGKTSVTNTKHTEKVSETTVTITPGQPNLLPFTPTHTGRHIITLQGTDKDGNPFSTTTALHVYGTDESPWAAENGMKIKLVPEKKQYTPGETARILVMTPIEGTALITVERSGVLREFRHELKANNPVIEIPITDMDAPNAFVSVIIIRGANDSPRKAKEPALKLGYCTLHVTNVKDRLAIKLTPEGSQHRPAESTTISGTVTLANGSPAVGAEVVLYAEDEGTLAVMGYNNPDPMKTFHAPRPLLVECGTSFSTFLSENTDGRDYGNKGFTIGGGDGDPFGSRGTTLKSRTDFNPCAVWKPSLLTDANGKFSATFTNPDTLTRYRVIAVTLLGNEKFGNAETHYTVNKPIMLEPAAPRYASEGDHLSPKVLVQNNSKFSGTWEISLSTTSLTRLNNATSPIKAKKTITIKPGGAETVYFDVTFTASGDAQWIWTARPVKLNDNTPLTPVLAKNLSDQSQSTFKITYPVPLMKQVQFVTMDNGGQQNILANLDPKLLDGQGKIELTLSNSLLVEAAGAVDFLLHYPYGCVEQTSSSMMPWFAVRDLKSLVPGFKEKKDADIAKAIQTGADRLLTMQTRDGGLAYWPGGDEPEVWASAYGGMAMILAKKHGATVPETAINQLTDWLANSLKKDLKENSNTHSYNSWDMETRARALYVLAMAGKPEAGLQNKMLDHLKQLNPSARAFLALAIHTSSNGADDSRARGLLTNSRTRPASKHWMRHTSDLPMQVLAWSEIFPNDPQVHKAMRNMLANRNPYGHWRTTWCNAWALRAMASYAKNVENNRRPTTIQLVTAGETQSLTLDDTTPTRTIHIPLATLKKDMKLLVSGNATYHTNTLLSSKPKLAPTGPWAHNGLSIVRRYERLLPDGTSQPMAQPHVGDLIRVNLDITFPDALDYVVIEDRLPALFETVNNQFASQRSHHTSSSDNDWQISHKELRSDRAVFFIDRSWQNATRTISYLARVTTAGTATAPAAKVEAMYDPEQLALTKSATLTTLKKTTVAVGQ